ncbi:hypothetical protein [Asanoa iriomotensis]|uniref:Uncharacterized protein n=1 Tax=Asanoa iriomotensis TaxID=234613 RepID=A0ABQ4CFB2_9ACTN|nr:hypothetical protein [Asanoa iriomotensis]GIF61458.1 hypothetical protein Air01nite_75530 [Asanoa iriomotensis]
MAQRGAEVIWKRLFNWACPMIAEVRCDTSSLEVANSGNIWGNIWISYGDQHFPELGWNDMPVAFLVELVGVVRRLAVSESRRVLFFDGPFWIDLTRTRDSLLIARGRSNEVPLQAMNVELEAFITNVITQARHIVEACVTNGWGDQQDVRRLAQLVK